MLNGESGSGVTLITDTPHTASAYQVCKPLARVAKDCYFGKLPTMGLKEVDSLTCTAMGSFMNGMILRPPVEYGHIFGYFIQRPGV